MGLVSLEVENGLNPSSGGWGGFGKAGWLVCFFR